MNLRHLNNDSLVFETRRLVQEERRISLALLYHLREIERRLLHAELGYSSLYDYATRALGYGEAAAHRRIQSARLLAECPELAPKIETGSLNLSLLSQAQSFFRNEEVHSTEKKREILSSLENKSSREAEKKLMSMASEPPKHRPERKRQVSPKYSEIRFMADADFVAQLDELKDLLGARSYRDTLAYALRIGLEKKKPKLAKHVEEIAEKVVHTKTTKHVKEVAAQVEESNSIKENNDSAEPIKNPPDSPLLRGVAELGCSGRLVQTNASRRTSPASLSLNPPISPPTSEVTSRYIPVEIRRRVWARDQGQCTYRGSQSAQRCQSRFGLELDHFVTAFARGGKHSVENLTLRCKAHNQLGAVRAFGHVKMADHLPKLR